MVTPRKKPTVKPGQVKVKPQALPPPPDDFEGIRYENGVAKFYFNAESRARYAEIAAYNKKYKCRWTDHALPKETWSEFKKRVINPPTENRDGEE